MELKTLISDFSKSLADGFGTIFVGAGVSARSGLPGWAELLEPFAKNIDITIRAGDNLPLIAQHIVNYSKGNRGPLLQHIKSLLTGSFPMNSYHTSLTRMNVRTLWTTNYDTLLERAFSNFVLDIKASDDAISHSVPSHEIEILKIHGCIASSDAQDLVLTSEDYEDFFEKRPATTNRLRSDLLSKSFLFIGYGYSDPDIGNILVQARRLCNNSTRQHFMIQKTADAAEECIRQKLWIDDLKRLGIWCVLIDDYDSLDEALRDIALKSRGPTVYVTGGHKSTPAWAQDYGKALSRIKNLILFDGQSTGVSRGVISAFIEACLSAKEEVLNRIRLFPNPYAVNPKLENDPDLLKELKKWRAVMLRSTQVVIVFDGGMGTQAEVDVASDLGAFIVPVPYGRNELPFRLLQDKSIRSTLQEKVPEYLSQADSLSLTAEVVARCVQKLIAG